MTRLPTGKSSYIRHACGFDKETPCTSLERKQRQKENRSHRKRMLGLLELLALFVALLLLLLLKKLLEALGMTKRAYYQPIDMRITGDF